MAAIMNTAQRFAAITAMVTKSKQLIADNPACPLVLEQCVTCVENALKAEPNPDNNDLPTPTWHNTCARAILDVLGFDEYLDPKEKYANLVQESTYCWVDIDSASQWIAVSNYEAEHCGHCGSEECDGDCQSDSDCEAE